MCLGSQPPACLCHQPRHSLAQPAASPQHFNAQPYEIILAKDVQQQPLNFMNPVRATWSMSLQSGDAHSTPLLRPPLSLPSQCTTTGSTPTCGYVYDGDGTAILNSQGFCCSCSLASALGITDDEKDLYRATSKCDIDVGQTAHCMRMSLLWYAGYSIGAASVAYTVELDVVSCSGADNTCTSTTLKLSPTAPALCYDPTGNVIASGSGAQDCLIEASLEGDLAAFEDTPTLSNLLLFIPSTCALADSECIRRLGESSERWMLLNRADVSVTGDECNKVGVGYSTFSIQPSGCSAQAGECLKNQLETYYQADAYADAAGHTGQYWVKYHTMGGPFNPKIQGSSGASMEFVTNRFQKSLITLKQRADRFAYVRRVVPGQIVDAFVSDFQAMSGDGLLSVLVISAGKVPGDFTLTADCGSNFVPLVAKQFSLQAPPNSGSSRTCEWQLSTTSTSAGQFFCDVRLLNSQGVVTDTALVNVTVTAQQMDQGAQSGNLSSSAPGASNNDANANGSLSCSDKCDGIFDLLCLLAVGCVAEVVVVVVCAVLVIGCCFGLAKRPHVLCAPCLLLLRTPCLIGTTCAKACATRLAKSSRSSSRSKRSSRSKSRGKSRSKSKGKSKEKQAKAKKASSREKSKSRERRSASPAQPDCQDPGVGMWQADMPTTPSVRPPRVPRTPLSHRAPSWMDSYNARQAQQHPAQAPMPPQAQRAPQRPQFEEEEDDYPRQYQARDYTEGLTDDMIAAMQHWLVHGVHPTLQQLHPQPQQQQQQQQRRREESSSRRAAPPSLSHSSAYSMQNGMDAHAVHAPLVHVDAELSSRGRAMPSSLSPGRGRDDPLSFSGTAHVLARPCTRTASGSIGSRASLEGTNPMHMSDAGSFRLPPARAHLGIAMPDGITSSH